MRVVAKGKVANDLLPVEKFKDNEEMYLDAVKITRNCENYFKTHWFLEDAFPSACLNLGAGSMALYLGSQPHFAKETVWFTECIDDWDRWGKLRYDADNHWWKTHLKMLKTAKELSCGNFPVSIPDIVENVDVLSAMRGPQQLCYDLIEIPETINDYIEQVGDLYFKYYDEIYDIVKEPDGSSAYTAFAIWGPGRTAKLQCDFCAMISTDHFKQFVQQSLRKQCRRIDNTIYHLDGPDAIRHVPALMEIEELNCLQWTSGAGQPDGGCECWYPIYDRAREANKTIWIYFTDGVEKDWVEGCRRLIKRYGPDCFYFYFNDFEDKKTAEEFTKTIKEACK